MTLRRVTRVAVAPALLVACAGLAFFRAYDAADLFVAILTSVVLGGLVGWAIAERWRLGSGKWRWLVIGVVVVAGASIGAVVVAERLIGVWQVPEAISTFLVVGIPAPGLPRLSLVVFAVLYPAMIISTWASVGERTLTTLAAPVVALALTGLLVEPVGIPWWAPLLLAIVMSGVLVADVRHDLASLPSLTGTEEVPHDSTIWWRPLAQALPVLLVGSLAAAFLPHPATFDIRRFVEPDKVHVEDPNPLAVAARWRGEESSEPTVEVTVDGPTPGRLRVAVLDKYTDTGWEQASDYRVTGNRFAADPVFPDGIASDAAGAPTTDVTVQRTDPTGFRAIPTAGVAESTDDPRGLRYAPEAGAILANDPERRVDYEAGVAATEAPATDQPLPSKYPVELASCPSSDPLQSVASQLTVGITSVSARLAAIENWLLTRRIYDPAAPGGQTLGSTEEFVSQSFARGNLEAFVTAYALLARCAGVPVRVVVGYPAPESDTNDYRRGDITAWVEVPLADAGWVPFDPLPTPAEQELQAQLAQQPPPDEVEEPSAPSTPPQEVDPSDVPHTPWVWIIVAIVLLVAALVAAWALLVPRLIGKRRRHYADPDAAVMAAWSTVVESLIDRGVPVEPWHTPAELVRLSSLSMPVTVPGLVAGMVPLVDGVRYSGHPAVPLEAGQAWAHADAIEVRLPQTASSRFVGLVHPFRQFRRLRSTIRVPRRPQRWFSVLPDTSLLGEDDAPEDIPGVSIQARLGNGSTAAVFRGVLDDGGTPVAVKVFHYGPEDPGFDQSRFDWEVRIAREVSGLPHLPVVHDAGIAPSSGRPYLVSSIYEQGTLLDRVRLGGPMTLAEACAIGGDLAVALEALHQLGVIHADVKPENVFASDDGWVLGDLGSAWLRAGHGPAASLTPPYAAPEVWRGTSPTHEADIYSLALTMMFARTAKVPVAGNPPTPDDIVAAFEGLPIMLRALDPDPRRRPVGVAELGKVLRPGFFSGVVGGRVMTLSLPTPTVTHRSD